MIFIFKNNESYGIQLNHTTTEKIILNVIASTEVKDPTCGICLHRITTTDQSVKCVQCNFYYCQECFVKSKNKVFKCPQCRLGD